MQGKGRDATLRGFDIGKDKVVRCRKVDRHVPVVDEFIVHHHTLLQAVLGNELGIRLPRTIAFTGHDQHVVFRQFGQRLEKHVQAFVGANQPKNKWTCALAFRPSFRRASFWPTALA